MNDRGPKCVTRQPLRFDCKLTAKGGKGRLGSVSTTSATLAPLRGRYYLFLGPNSSVATARPTA